MSDFEKIMDSGKEWAKYLCKNAKDYLIANGKYDVCYAYDPMTLGMLDREDLFEFENWGNVNVAINVDGKKFNNIF
ncbi:MAG: hypothetical protein U9Q69_01090 [Nanoarchaeota archaeon]|nr:hypothetical protein [Nanoarchaeota archaeon]